MSVEAEFQGVCAGCGGAIVPGQQIELPEFSSAWAHVTCPPMKFDLVREVCGECFTERAANGKCMCEAMP